MKEFFVLPTHLLRTLVTLCRPRGVAGLHAALMKRLGIEDMLNPAISNRVR